MVIQTLYMICKKCGKEKPESEFYNDKSKSTGKKPRCKPCDLLSRDKEKRAKYESEYWSHPERAERKRNHVRASMEKNKDRYAKKRREYLRTDAGAAVYRRYTQKRYALVKNAFVEDVNPYDIFKEQGGVCYLCGNKFDFKKMELDHVYPIARGGLHEKANCKMACAHCNRSKGSKTLEELSYQMV